MIAPLLAPPYAGDMCGSAWHQYTDERGQFAYLTANRPITGPVPPITNSARWQPQLAAGGWFTVEAYIPAHGVTPWECPDRTIPADTRGTLYRLPCRWIDAASRQPSRCHQQWLDLGVYFFDAGNAGYVELTDETTEEAFASTISFSTMRFIATTTTFSPTMTVMLPLVAGEEAAPSEPRP